MQALIDAIASLTLPVTPAAAGRCFHGRGGLYPGCEAWTLDWYPPVWLLTRFQSDADPAHDAELRPVVDALAARWQQLAPQDPFNLVFQTRGGGAVAGRGATRLLAGAVPELHVVSEGDARLRVHLTQGQNHGLFLDMAAGRRWVGEHVAARPGLKVLNLFAYTCAFSVVALQAGAREVVNLDMAAAALAIGQHNHRLSGVAGGARFLAHDLFSSWGKVTRGGPYGLVIADPPSYQKGSFVASKDYPRLLRRLPDLLAPGGHALLCLNAPEIGAQWLVEQVAEQAPGLRFLQRLANPPSFADIDPERALKALVFQAPGTARPLAADGAGPP